MRNLQEIFNVIIDNGYYHYHERKRISHNSSSFMCISLNMAYDDKLISIEEYKKAENSINRYMEILNKKAFVHNVALASALFFNNFKKTPIQVYKDWKNRPRKRNLV